MSDYIEKLFSLLKNRELGITEFQLTEFPVHELLQEDKKISSTVVNEALDIRKNLGTPFWDSLLSTFLKPSGDVEYGVFSHALKHNTVKDVLFFKEVDDLKRYVQENSNKNIALLSEVKLEGQVKKHLPMIDFHIPVSKQNTVTVEKVIDSLGLGTGIIVNSGKSYHFIGFNLISSKELISFLGKMVLLTPIIDKNWIAHQLIERKAALRISKGHKSDLRIIKHTP